MIPATDYIANAYGESQQMSAFVESVNEEFRNSIIGSQNAPSSSPGKFEKLKAMIGDELYAALSEENRLFMVETAGTIDFGHAVNLDDVARNIEEYGDTE